MIEDRIVASVCTWQKGVTRGRRYPTKVPFLRQNVVQGDDDSPDLLRGELRVYFTARQKYENGRLDGFDREALIRLRDDRQRFSGPEFDALFGRWKEGGEAVLEV